MAFFDDLGRKLTSVSQSAVQKTKDVADIAKINAEISELERTVNNLYYQIGKLYVAKHAADYKSDFADMIGSEGDWSDINKHIRNGIALSHHICL